uniref:Acid-sensing ion channel 1 n=1 Tax=Strongyloides stercoralis TaxID=6248 RepID=A0A0K0EAW3_STRER
MKKILSKFRQPKQTKPISNNYLNFFKTFFIILRDFSQWSTIAGFNHIFGSSNILIVLFWIIVTGICVFIGIYQAFQLTSVYFLYPVNTELIPYYKEITFPAITICERSPFINNRKNKYLNKIVDAFSSETNYPWGLYDIDDNDNYKPISDLFHFWLGIYSNELLTDDNINYKWSEYIISCYFNRNKCEEKNFKTIKLPSFGTCFTLNHLGEWKVARSGNDYSLKLTFKINEDNTLPYFYSNGALMYIHSYLEYPFFDLDPIFLSPGNDISIGLSFETTSRLPHPYGTCIPKDNSKLKGTDNFYNGMYQNEKCIRSCIQRKIIENCKCYFAGYAISNEFSSIPSCSEYIDTNESERSNILQCIKKHIYPTLNTTDINYFLNTTSDCTCYDVCERTFYYYSCSYGKYPSSTFIPTECKHSTIIDAREKNISVPYLYTQKDCLSYFSKNTISLEIFFEKLSYVANVEYADYALIQLFYDLVGVLGFWIGISLITFFEIFIFFGALIGNSIKSLSKASKEPIKTREVRKNVHDNIKNDMDNLRKYPPRKDLYDQAAEMDKMPPIQEG